MLCTIMDISEVAGRRAEARPADLPAQARSSTSWSSSTTKSRRTKNITVTANIDPAGTITADRNRLQLLLSNLLDNAVKYTPNGGTRRNRRRVLPRPRSASPSAIPASASTRTICPASGTASIARDKSRSQRGLGLGLSLVKAFVEAHGGTATVTSTPGQGSVFTVSFPNKKSK